GVVAVAVVQGADAVEPEGAVEPEAVEGEQLVLHREADPGGVLDLQGAGDAGVRVAVDDGTAGGRAVAQAQGARVPDGQDAVVDRGRAAVAVGRGEDELAGALLGNVVADAQVADRALDGEDGGVGGAEGDVAVQLDGCGHGVVAGEVVQGSGGGAGRP